MNELAPDLTVAGTAKRLSVSIRTVQNWLSSGKLTGYKVASQWRIPESSILALISDSQPSQLRPIDADEIRSRWTERSFERHMAGIRRNLRQLRGSLGGINYRYQLERWIRSWPAQEFLPGFNRMEWKTIEQHLVGTTCGNAFADWKRAAEALIEAERELHQIAIQLGEKQFGLKFGARDGDAAGRLAPGFPAVAIHLAGRTDTLEDALADLSLPWDNGILTYYHGEYLVIAREMSAEDCRDLFFSSMREAVNSDEGQAVRGAVARCQLATTALEDELDGIDVSGHIPGSCEFCFE